MGVGTLKVDVGVQLFLCLSVSKFVQEPSIFRVASIELDLSASLLLLSLTFALSSHVVQCFGYI